MLTPETHKRIDALFAESQRQEVVRHLEQECGNNLPFMEKATAKDLERIRFAALKVSGGRMPRLQEAVQLAKVDWRDLLVGAGFEGDPTAHERWFP